MPTALFYLLFSSQCFPFNGFILFHIYLSIFYLMCASLYFLTNALFYQSFASVFPSIGLIYLTVSSVFTYQHLFSALVCLYIFLPMPYLIIHLLLTTPFQMTENLLSCLPLSTFLPIVSFYASVLFFKRFYAELVFRKHHSTASCYFSFSSQYILSNSFVLFDIYPSVFSTNEFAFLYFSYQHLFYQSFASQYSPISCFILSHVCF